MIQDIAHADEVECSTVEECACELEKHVNLEQNREERLASERATWSVPPAESPSSSRSKF